MHSHSIRFRLTVWYAIVLTTGLVIFGSATWLTMRHSLLNDLDQSLNQQIESAHSFVIAELNDPTVHLAEELDEYAHALPSGANLRITDTNGAVVFTSNPNFPWANSQNRVRWNGHRYMLLSEDKIVNNQTWHFTSSASMDVADRLLDRLRLSLFTLLPVVVVVASVGGWWLSRRALKPVDNLTQAARSISLENLSNRLHVPHTGDELQRLAETWNSMLSRLEESVTRLSRFAADASHELRTPLALIRTTAELAARRDRSPDDYRQALLGIVAESGRMTALLDDLLLFARVDAGSVELPKSIVDLSALVAQVCSQIQPMAEAKDLKLKFASTAQTFHLTANEPAIRRLVLVLLDNAVKYSKSGGEITVSLHPEATALNLEISDSGPGIQHDHLPHIFERFYRSPDARQMNPDGSGLGLSLAAAIAQRHNAEIKVTSWSESGSTFRVLFNN